MDNAKKKRAPSKKGGNGFLTSLICGFIGLLITFILTLIFAAAALKAADPNTLVTPLALVSAALGGFISAFFAVRKSSVNPFAAGGISILPTLTVMLVATFVAQPGKGVLSALIVIAALIIPAVIGVLAASRPRSRRRSMKRAVSAAPARRK